MYNNGSVHVSLPGWAREQLVSVLRGSGLASKEEEVVGEEEGGMPGRGDTWAKRHGAE